MNFGPLQIFYNKFYPKHVIQKLRRGYSDEDLWDLGNHLAEIILPRLKDFKRVNTHGYPNGLTESKWDEILNKMLYAFENTVNEPDFDFNTYDDTQKKIQEGFELFGKYFQSLWD